MTGTIDNSPEAVMAELLAAGRGLDEAADELRRLMPRFEGWRDTDEVFHPGASLRWQMLFDQHIAGIAEAYENRDKRPPAKDILEARARAAAKTEDPDLWAEFHALDSRIKTLQKWMSAKKETIGAKQSWLKAQGVLVSGPQPQWSGRGA